MSKREEAAGGRASLVRAGSFQRNHTGKDLLDWIASPASPVQDRFTRRPSLEADNGLIPIGTLPLDMFSSSLRTAIRPDVALPSCSSIGFLLASESPVAAI
jgi:hypothetical protein